MAQNTADSLTGFFLLGGISKSQPCFLPLQMGLEKLLAAAKAS